MIRLLIGLLVTLVFIHLFYKTKMRELYLNFLVDVPVYLISLEKDKDRRDMLFAIVTPNHVSTTHGKDLNIQELIKKGIIKNTKMTKGEYGCYFSHYNILKKIHETGDKDGVSLILEDDAKFNYLDVNNKIKDIVDNFKQDWDVIGLGHNYYKDEGTSQTHHVGDSELKEINYLHGAQGLLINNKNVHKYKNLLPIEYPYDVALPLVLKMFVLEPKIIHLGEFAGNSNTQGIR